MAASDIPVHRVALAAAALIALLMLIGSRAGFSPLRPRLFSNAGHQCPAPLSARQRAAWEATAGANLAALEATDRLHQYRIAWPEPASADAVAAWEQRQRPERVQPDVNAPYAVSKPLLPPEFQKVAKSRGRSR